MKALTYQSSKNVSVQTVPDPVLEQDDDIILRVTATAICGSDLHIYRGKIPDMESGDILGHEFMGIVDDTGKGVTRLRKGDRVVVPFTIAWSTTTGCWAGCARRAGIFDDCLSGFAPSCGALYSRCGVPDLDAPRKPERKHLGPIFSL